LVRTALALLERDAVLANLVWRDAAGDFRGAKDDTISIRLPAYAKANKRALRSGDARTVSTLHERKVDVTLDTDLYQRVKITDEELTLDIESFERQVVVPVAGALIRGIEDEIVDEVQGASYENEVTIDRDAPYDGIVDARRKLNDARVPADGRILIMGSEVESVFLKDDQFVRADASGSTETLRNAQIGRVAGLAAISVPALEPDEAYAFHRTAYVLNSRAPMVPASAAAGSTIAADGFALRVVQILEPDTVVDNFHADVWVGTNIVEDFGKMTNGRFQPGIDPEDPAVGEADRFVRAVKLTLGS
jgi:hypothetical protein